MRDGSTAETATRPYAGPRCARHVGSAARQPAREGAVSPALSAYSSFSNPLSKLQNSKKCQLT
jgi:hypothetical protein